jgi:hypothetical protein
VQQAAVEDDVTAAATGKVATGVQGNKPGCGLDDALLVLESWNLGILCAFDLVLWMADCLVGGREKGKGRGEEEERVRG